MTVIQPPGFMQNLTTHTAETDRSVPNVLTMGPLAAASLKSFGGVNMTLGGALKVTQSGSPAMSVDVAAGTCLVPGSEGSKQGQYTVVNDAAVTLTVTAASPTLPRIDLVVMQIQDQQYSGASNQALLAVIAGTPASSPVPPTQPADSIILAQVAVGANVTQILNANITDKRLPITAAGGIYICTSATRPTNNLYEGLTIYLTDRDWIEVYDGSFWRVRGQSVVSSFANLSQITSPYNGQIATDTATNTVWQYNGSMWVPVQLAGVITVSFTSLNNFSPTAVTFAQPFDVTPTVVMNIDSGSGSTARWYAKATTSSTTGFQPLLAYMSDGSTTSTWSSVPVGWVATAR